MGWRACPRGISQIWLEVRGGEWKTLGFLSFIWRLVESYPPNMATLRFFFFPHNVATWGPFFPPKNHILQTPFFLSPGCESSPKINLQRTNL